MDTGPGAGAAAAGSVVVLLFTLAAILLPVATGVALFTWVLLERRKARRGASA
jgi:hypothetical protein